MPIGWTGSSRSSCVSPLTLLSIVCGRGGLAICLGDFPDRFLSRSSSFSAWTFLLHERMDEMMATVVILARKRSEFRMLTSVYLWANSSLLGS